MNVESINSSQQNLHYTKTLTLPGDRFFVLLYLTRIDAIPDGCKDYAHP